MSETAIKKSQEIAQAVAGNLGGRGLFGKPEAFEKRRVGTALAYGSDVDDAKKTCKKRGK